MCRLDSRLRGNERNSESLRSGVVAEIAAERVGLLHQRGARHDFENLPEVLLALHLLGRLTLDDDHRPYELVVFLAEVHLADSGLELLALRVGLDDVRWIEAAGILHHARPD